MFIFPAASAPDSCLYCSLLADGWSAGGSEGEGGERGCRWVQWGWRWVRRQLPTGEDKWMALTFPSGQRPGQQTWPTSPPPDTDLVFWLPSFIPCCASLSFLPFPSLPSLSPSFLVLIWFDWCRNVALLKVAAEEQWGIVLFHTHTHTKGM